jgi:hypothetical protein
MNNGELDHNNLFDTINHIFVIFHHVFLNITSEQLEEGKGEASRRDRMEIINNMDEESREKLRNKEF